MSAPQSKFGVIPRIHAVGLEQALAFWQTCPNATPFMHPQVLGALCSEVTWWLAEVDAKPVCLWPACVRLDGMRDTPEFSYYVGPSWAPIASEGSARARMMLRSAVIDALCTHMVEQYRGFSCELSPGDQDLRGFRWWALARGRESQLQIKPQYTAVIRALATLDETAILQRFSSKRRSRVRRYQREHTPLQRPWELADCLRLYAQLAQRVSQIHLRTRDLELAALCALVRDGFGFVHAYTDSDGQPIRGLRLALTLGDTACDVLSITDPQARASDLSAWMTWRALLHSRVAGVKVHDFNGANGLTRASDIHSYGAEAELYFSIEYSESHATG